MGGGEAPSTTTQTLDLMTGQQKNILSSLGNYLNNSSNAITPYKGTLSTGDSNLQKQTYSGVESFLNQIPSLQQQNQQNNTDYMGQLKSIIDAGPADTEAYYKTNVEQPAMRTYNQSVLPTIEKTFAGGRYGSDFQRQVQASNQELQNNLVKSRESLLKDQLDQMYNRKLQAIGLEGQLPSMQATQSNTINTMLNTGLTAGTSQRATTQEALDKQYLEFIRQQDQKQAGITNILNYLSQRSVENVVSNNGGSSNNTGQMIGAGASAVGAGVAIAVAI
jgi:hypothetical protein